VGQWQRDGGRSTDGVWRQGFGGCWVSESRQHSGNVEVWWAKGRGSGSMLGLAALSRVPQGQRGWLLCHGRVLLQGSWVSSFSREFCFVIKKNTENRTLLPKNLHFACEVWDGVPLFAAPRSMLCSGSTGDTRNKRLSVISLPKERATCLDGSSPLLQTTAAR